MSKKEIIEMVARSYGVSVEEAEQMIIEDDDDCVEYEQAMCEMMY